MFYTSVCPCTSKSLKSPILTRISLHSIYLVQFYIQYDDGDAEDLVDRRNIKGKESRKGMQPGYFIQYKKDKHGKEDPRYPNGAAIKKRHTAMVDPAITQRRVPATLVKDEDLSDTRRPDGQKKRILNTETDSEEELVAHRKRGRLREDVKSEAVCDALLIDDERLRKSRPGVDAVDLLSKHPSKSSAPVAASTKSNTKSAVRSAFKPSREATVVLDSDSVAVPKRPKPDALSCPKKFLEKNTLTVSRDRAGMDEGSSTDDDAPLSKKAEKKISISKDKALQRVTADLPLPSPRGSLAGGKSLLDARDSLRIHSDTQSVNITRKASLSSALPIAKGGHSGQHVESCDKLNIDVVTVGAEEKNISLNDPLLKTRIHIPCTGDGCDHLDVFDRNAFVRAHAVADEEAAARGQDLLVNALHYSIDKVCKVTLQTAQMESACLDYDYLEEEFRYTGEKGAPGEHKTFVQIRFKLCSKQETVMSELVKKLRSAESWRHIGYSLQEYMHETSPSHPGGEFASAWRSAHRVLKNLRINLLRAYKSMTLNKQLLELDVQQSTGCLAFVVAHVQVDAPGCPHCNKPVLELKDSRLRKELERHDSKVRDAEIIRVDHKYNLIEVVKQRPAIESDVSEDSDSVLTFTATKPVCQEDGGKGISFKTEAQTYRSRHGVHYDDRDDDLSGREGREEGVNSGFSWSNSQADRSRLTPRPESSQERHHGTIVTVNRRKDYWYCFLRTEFISENIYCNLREYQSDLLMAAPSPLSLDDGDKSLAWIRGHVVTFALSAEQDRFQGGIRRTAVKVRFPFLEEAARTGPPPEQILSSPRDPRLVSAPQDPRLAQHLRTQAPQDPRQKPQDPRRAGQASGAHMFLGEPRLIASTLCGAKAAETAFAGRTGTALVGRVERVKATLEDPKAWLLENGAYICQMQVKALPMQNETNRASCNKADKGDVLQWEGCACIDMTHTFPLDRSMLSRAGLLCKIPCALLSPAKGSICDVLVEEISALCSTDLIAVGNLKTGVSAEHSGETHQVLLIPPASDLWTGMRTDMCKNWSPDVKISTAITPPGAQVFQALSSAVAAHAAADRQQFEARLRRPLREDEMIMCLLDDLVL